VTVTARPGLAVLVTLVVAVVGGCAPAPAPTQPPSAAPRPTPSATRSPTPTPSLVASIRPAPLPDDSVAVPIPLAGISLPIPVAWERIDADDLADDARREDAIARYPGADRLLGAADALGDRATPALLALDPATPPGDGSITPNIAVLVAQPAVSGPLLDLVAGFIADGFREAFGTAAPDRERVSTPIGDAIRLSFEVPAEGAPPHRATAWVIGAEAGTLLVSVIGPAGEGPAADPDAFIDAAAPLP
jgi:hypothetical protein